MLKSIPKHIAITMDGNGRWGEMRGLTRSEGHFAGAETMEKMIDSCIELDVKILTLYAFSSENWSRPKSEVNYLMRLPIRFFKQKLPGFMQRNIKILIAGDLEKVPRRTRKALLKAVKTTRNNAGLIVNFAFNYGGRDEIVNAIKQIAREVKNEKIKLNHVDEAVFERFLYTKDLPDPALFIRTGGEKRLSNFLLWQAADAELYFSDLLFPEFTHEELEQAILEWQRKLPFEMYLENNA